jgi:large subunit ribosomal protein L23
MRTSNIIINPITTEKSVDQSKAGYFVFKVRANASKGSVADEVERIYGVNVVGVKTMILPGKKRRITGTSRFKKSASWKKAIVILKGDQKIEFFSQGK